MSKDNLAQILIDLKNNPCDCPCRVDIEEQAAKMLETQRRRIDALESFIKGISHNCQQITKNNGA